MRHTLHATAAALALCTGHSAHAQPPFRTGVNFPFYMPGLVSIHDYLELLDGCGTPAIRQMAFADVHWAQVEPADNAWDWARADSAFLNPFGITPIGTLYSMMGEDEVGMQTPWLACSDPFSCYWDPAGDSLHSKDYVLQTVNRYSSATKYWEVTNEIEFTLPPEGLMSIAAKKDFLRYNYNWIKAADPAAQVLLPGLLGTCCTYPQSNSYTWLRQMLNAGAGSYFDIMNYHDYNAWWTLPAHYDSIQSILGEYGLSKPIWITETSISSSSAPPITPSYSSPDAQAADVWRRIALLWAKGAEVVLWHTGWSNPDMTGWGEFGLISSSGARKKSYHAYLLLNEKLTGFSSAQILSQGAVTDSNTSGGNGAWVLRFVVDGQQKWVLWSPNGAPYTLTGIAAPQIQVTSVVPISLGPSGSTATFQQNTYPVNGGTHAFAQLPANPILVEELLPTAVDEPRGNTGLHLLPNPAAERITLQRADGLPLGEVRLLGPDGRTLRSAWAPGERLTLDVSGLAPGLYTMSCADGGSRPMARFVKE